MQWIRAGERRDLRIDIFRGLALWWIFTDHIPGNTLGHYSLHNVVVCDAAEIFVLLAGFAAAKAYGGTMDRHGWAYGAADAVKRAWTLYIAHIFLFVIYAALVAFAATALHRPDYVSEVKLDVMARTPFPALLQALTLQYQPSMLNILPLYVALLVMFAVAMPLLHRPKRLLPMSIGLYLVVQWSRLNLPGWGGTHWYFDPFAWQLVFVIGAVISYGPIPRPRRPRLLDALAVLVLGADLLLIFWARPNAADIPWMTTPLLDALMGTDKTAEAPARLASLLALLWLAGRLVPVHASWLRRRPAAMFALLGQHSLPVFCFSIVLAFLCRLGLQAAPGAAMQVVVNAGGLLCLLAVAATAAWCGTPGRSQRPLRGPVRTPAPLPAAEHANPPQIAPVPATGRFRSRPLLPRPVALKAALQAAVHHW